MTVGRAHRSNAKLIVGTTRRGLLLTFLLVKSMDKEGVDGEKGEEDELILRFLAATPVRSATSSVLPVEVGRLILGRLYFPHCPPLGH